MRKSLKIIVLLLLLVGCKTSEQIADQESYDLQREIRKSRTGLNFAEAGIYFGAIVLSAATGTGMETTTSPQGFKKLKISNESPDTLIVNMVTDYVWKDNKYCDIRGIKIPPNDYVKVITPKGASYNVYFRVNQDAEDESIEINTAEKKGIRLRAGMTKLPE